MALVGDGIPLPLIRDRPCIAGDLVPAQFQERRRDVQQVGTVDFALKRAVGGSQDEGTELGVVAVVRPGVVLEDVDGRIADSADRPPVQRPEVDDQVGATLRTAR